MRQVTAFLFASILAVSLARPGVARADEPPRTSAEMHADMQGYYEGEANSAYGIFVLGMGGVAAGGMLVPSHDDFARGLGWPLLVLGGIEAVGAVGYATQVEGETAHYERSFAANQAAFRDEEATHIHGTTSRFFFYQLTELAITLGGAGIGVYGLAADKDAWKGAGLGLAALGLPLLAIDAVNQRRASRYEERLQRLAPPTPRADSGRERSPFDLATLRPTPWMFAWTTTF